MTLQTIKNNLEVINTKRRKKNDTSSKRGTDIKNFKLQHKHIRTNINWTNFRKPKEHPPINIEKGSYNNLKSKNKQTQMDKSFRQKIILLHK